MAQTKYAFIIKAPGYHPATHAAQMKSTAFLSRFVGVASFDETLKAAEELVSQGTQVIELCGGFTPQEATKLRRHLPDIEIGRVAYR